MTVTYEVRQLNGAYAVEFDEEREARDHALALMANGISVYLLRQTSEVLALFDAKKNEEVAPR